MSNYGAPRCTCPPSPCPACDAYNRSHTGVHVTGLSSTQGVPDLGANRKSPHAEDGTEHRVINARKSLSRQDILSLIGAWVVKNQRLPIGKDWRLPKDRRPPFNTARIYGFWRSIGAFYEDCVREGFATRAMIREAFLVSGKRRKMLRIAVSSHTPPTGGGHPSEE